jgi:hypothetical protein
MKPVLERWIDAAFVASILFLLVIAMVGCTGKRFDHRSDMCRRFPELCR